MATAEVEEVVKVTHDAPGEQKTLHPGVLPGILESDRTVRHSSGTAPSLSPPSLADAAADTVDHSLLAFLLKVALQLKKDEEGGRRGK